MSPRVDAMCRESAVIVTCGTGGVGKTSVAAALGLRAAQLGRRAVVITIDPARRLADAIGLSGRLGNDPVLVDTGSSVTGELWVTMLDVNETFDNLVRDASPTPERAREVMDNSFYRSLSRSLSGTRDYMAAERLHELHNDDRFDLVVIDTPPSRNALDFLESPERLANFLKHPLVRLLAAPGRGGMRLANAALTPVLKVISGVVGSDALSGVAAFLRSIDGMEQEFSRRALEVARTIRGDDTSFAVVASPAPDALLEAGHFVDELHRLGIDLRLVVANRMPPRFGTATSAEERVLAATGTGDEAIAHSVMADLCEDAELASAAMDGFTDHVRERFPDVAVATAAEFASDIHDMRSVLLLAGQLAAPDDRQ